MNHKMKAEWNVSSHRKITHRTVMLKITQVAENSLKKTCTTTWMNWFEDLSTLWIIIYGTICNNLHQCVSKLFYSPISCSLCEHIFNSWTKCLSAPRSLRKFVQSSDWCSEGCQLRNQEEVAAPQPCYGNPAEEFHCTEENLLHRILFSGTGPSNWNWPYWLPICS